MKKLTTEEFVNKAKSVHKNAYDYSVVNYRNNTSTIKVICKKHGEFLQKPAVHLLGFGCIKCRSERNTLTTEEFIKRAKKIHGNKYDYSKVVYRHSKKKVIIICPNHGDFKILPTSHVGKGNKNRCGCSRCYSERHAIVPEEFVNKCIKIHNGKYSYEKTTYKSPDHKIIITCPTHGNFKQLPFNHLSGQGCKKCTSNISNKEINFLDLLNIREENRQKRIGKYLVDGYSPDTNTVCQLPPRLKP